MSVSLVAMPQESTNRNNVPEVVGMLEREQSSCKIPQVPHTNNMSNQSPVNSSSKMADVFLLVINYRDII